MRKLLPVLLAMTLLLAACGHITYTAAAPLTPEEAAPRQAADRGYVLNIHTKKFHYPYCASVPDMLPENRQDSAESRDALVAAGYSPCGNCKP